MLKRYIVILSEILQKCLKIIFIGIKNLPLVEKHKYHCKDNYNLSFVHVAFQLSLAVIDGDEKPPKGNSSIK